MNWLFSHKAIRSVSAEARMVRGVPTGAHIVMPAEAKARVATPTEAGARVTTPAGTLNASMAARVATSTGASIVTPARTRAIPAVASIAPIIAAIFLIICFSLLLCGCKYSDVLTEHVEDPENGQIDQNADPLYKESQNAPEDSSKISAQLSNTDDRIDDQKQDLPDYDEETENEEESDNYEQEEDSAHDQTATEGKETSDKQKDNSSARKNGKDSDKAGSSTEQSDDGEGDDDAKSDGSASGDGDGNRSDTDGGGSGSDKAQVYDTNSTPEKLPDNTGTVACAGQYATLVQMLAGQAAKVLVAADSDWVSRVNDFGAFSQEGTESVSIGWSGNGSAQNADIDAIKAARPDAVLVDGSVSDLTEDARNELTEQGINVLVVPTLGKVSTRDSDIIKAAQIVGSLLSSVTSGVSSSNAETYVKTHDSVLESARSANNGTYSYKMTNGTSYAYIYQGDDATTGTQTSSLGSTRITTVFIDSFFTGLTSSTIVANRHVGSATLALDGKTLDVSDGIGLSVASSGFALMDYYLQNAGVVNNAYNNAAPQEFPYVIAAGDVGESLLAGKQTSQRDMPSSLWYSPTGKDSDFITVGDTTFPCVVARDADTARSVATSRSKSNGFYNVGQHYDVAVMPDGLSGNWADGTIESFLMAPWAFGYLYGSAGTSNQAAADEIVTTFYKNFYRCGDDSLSKLKTHGYAQQY